MTRTHPLLASFLVLCCAPSVGAQVLQPPPRLVRGLFGGGRPPDPNRARQEVTLTTNLLGGYDDNLTPIGAGGDPLHPNPSGYVGFGDSALRYFLGREARSLEVTGRGYMNTYRNVGLTPSYGGDVAVHAATALGRRSRVQASSSVRYDPFFWLGMFGPLHDTAGITTPDQNPTNALTESRSWSTDATASVDRQWTRQTRTTLSYSFSKRTYVEGAGFDTRTHTGAVNFDRSFGRAWSVRTGYQYSDSTHEQQDGRVSPLVDQTGDLGVAYRRNISRTRQVSFGAGGGALHVDTVVWPAGATLKYWAPSGYGNARLDLGRSWSLAADYRRAVSVLEGLSPEAYVTDAATITVGGFVGPLIENVFTAGYSNGLTGRAPDNGRAGMYDGYTGTAQFRIRLTGWWSMLVSFNHFQYRLNALTSQSLGVPREMHRNSLRVGFTWSLPLYGAYLERERRQHS